MGSALTHLYYLLNPAKFKLVNPETQLEKGYVEVFNDFIKGQPFEKRFQVDKIDIEVEEILRYGILMDTFNFDKDQRERWTVYDQKAVEFIEVNKQYQLGFRHFADLKFS